LKENVTASADQVWAALLGGSIEALSLPRVEDRVDLRGLVAPEPTTLRSFSFMGAELRQQGGVIFVRNRAWSKIDFTGAQLGDLRFVGTTVADCKFDGATCRGWRLWGSGFVRTTFTRCDLRDSGMAGVDSGRHNAFIDVDFTRADLRETSHGAAEFTRCTFSETKLKKVDFNGSRFVDCTFTGMLDETAFAGTALAGGIPPAPPNKMMRVDFRRARFRWVEFRELELDHVSWPEGDEGIVVDDYISTIERFLRSLQGRTDLAAKQLIGYFSTELKWAPAGQRRGFVSKFDLREMGGESTVAEFLAAMRAAS
jgi:uncharacterized protein YjbI with pentapeptide repeats